MNNQQINNIGYILEYKRSLSIIISATSDPENIKNAISELLYARKEVANSMLTDTKNKELSKIYKRINANICDILGIAFPSEQ